MRNLNQRQNIQNASIFSIRNHGGIEACNTTCQDIDDCRFLSLSTTAPCYTCFIFNECNNSHYLYIDKKYTKNKINQIFIQHYMPTLWKLCIYFNWLSFYFVNVKFNLKYFKHNQWIYSFHVFYRYN